MNGSESYRRARSSASRSGTSRIASREFRRRYIEELPEQRPKLAELRERAHDDTLTLVFSARHTEHNDAVFLVKVRRRGLPRTGTQS